MIIMQIPTCQQSAYEIITIPFDNIHHRCLSLLEVIATHIMRNFKYLLNIDRFYMGTYNNM